MPYVYESGVIAAEPKQVWERIRDFNALPNWHPAIETSELEGGSDIGCVRHFFLKGGGELREKLLALSDHEFSCTYSILESPLSLKNYYAVSDSTRLLQRGKPSLNGPHILMQPTPRQKRKQQQQYMGCF
jgi:hypothetical protein